MFTAPITMTTTMSATQSCPWGVSAYVEVELTDAYLTRKMG